MMAGVLMMDVLAVFNGFQVENCAAHANLHNVRAVVKITLFSQCRNDSLAWKE
jgi:hypothetical protein